MSTSRKHTPGPWHWRLSDNATPHIEHGDCLPDEIGMLKNRVCVMPSEIMHDYNSLANARLIAAAPDLLEAAENIVSRWDSPLWKDQPHTGVFIDRLRAAIAKAKGEQP